MKCCRLLHKTSTISIPYNPYSIPLAIIIPKLIRVSKSRDAMAAAARVVPSLRSVINTLVPTQDGRSVSSDQMDVFILTIELVYRGIL